VANLPVLLIAQLLFWIVHPRDGRYRRGLAGHVRAAQAAGQARKKARLSDQACKNAAWRPGSQGIAGVVDFDTRREEIAIMAAVSFKPPSHWEDWCSWGLGIWLCISPWALRFELEPGATRVAVISGVLVILIEVVTLSAFRAWEEWLNVLLGAWLIAAPSIADIESSAATVNFTVIGVLVLVLALYELWRPGRGEGGA
jgi:hypothetical protein